MKVLFTNDGASVMQGALCPLRIAASGASHFSQLQVEIASAGVKNASSALGFSTQPRIVAPDTYEVDVNTGLLRRGFYEIRLIRFHSPVKNHPEPENVDYKSSRDFDRAVFFVGCIFDSPRSREQVVAELERREASFEAEFTSGIRISDSPDSISWSSLVFVKCLLLGRRTRFHKFEVFPFDRGLDSKDHRDLVNDFLKKATTTGLKFEYTDADRQISWHDNPVAIVHFPNVIAPTDSEVAQFAESQVNKLLSVLALTRDSKGEAFEIVVCPLVAGRDASVFPVRQPYRGNLVKGQISGEHAETLESYVRVVDANPFEYFLLQLYKEAIGEIDDDFRCLRLWQILELVAASKNYDKNLDLVDHLGAPIKMNDGQTFKVRNSVPPVYAVLRDYSVDVEKAWENVNIWFGFRSAVAHYGAVANYGQLERPEVRAWAKNGLEQNAAANGHNVVVSQLQTDVNLLLQKRLANHALLDGRSVTGVM